MEQSALTGKSRNRTDTSCLMWLVSVSVPPLLLPFPLSCSMIAKNQKGIKGCIIEILRDRKCRALVIGGYVTSFTNKGKNNTYKSAALSHCLMIGFLLFWKINDSTIHGFLAKVNAFTLYWILSKFQFRHTTIRCQ